MGHRQDPFWSTFWLIAANILTPVAILTFARGFFPHKPFIPGFAEFDAVTEYGDPPEAPFDKLVFMVIDALRSDFVYTANSGFEHTQSLIRNGAAIPFTAHATSPTVTMPRLKAITTGSIPSFLDVILNVNEGDESSTLASQDTWIGQMKARQPKKKLVMYGDDTWLKLFPGTFDRAEGTTSFFVSDFTEVDNNVTRHVADELKNDDWNTLVLHYLGLDHIGHKGGPRSSHMMGKQREMDGIIKQIFSAIESESHLQSTLFVVCGDHGMNDAGNHGASSPGETSPALVFLSPKFRGHLQKAPVPAPLPEQESFQYYTTVEQSDLAPTLAALLGVPVPKNNLGALIPEFLPFWPNQKDRIQLLMRNARQILNIVTAAFAAEMPDTPDACMNTDTDIQDLACRWYRIQRLATSSLSDEEEARWTMRTTMFLRQAQSVMSSMASNYDVDWLVMGQATAVVAVVCAVAAMRECVSDEAISIIPFAEITILYGVMMFGSSYVEEEQHFWYWATTAWLGLFGLRGLSQLKSRAKQGLAVVAMLVATRLIRGWNQTGQKFAGEPDIVKIFLASNPGLLCGLVGATYLWIWWELLVGFSNVPGSPAVNFVGATALTLAAATFKLAFTNEDAPELVLNSLAKQVLELEFMQGATLVSLARAVFTGLVLAMVCAVYLLSTKRRLSLHSPSIETLLHLYTLFAMTQSRTTNIPIFLLFHLLFSFLKRQKELSLVAVSTISLLLQYMSFFAFGGSNAISSVDLSSAYNGVSGFKPIPVGALTFVSNWAAPIYWAFATIVLLRRPRYWFNRRSSAELEGWSMFKEHISVLTVFTSFSVASVMAACTVLRTHLFIWTVFSPKYLYMMAWGLGHHPFVNVAVGGLLYWLGSFCP
ncbi:GPI ethanolamine phosphate transferase 2 [Diplogelasinospora grovesii]|uniref:GPI ethanolamine phosphate transferase 2 n=1 Tax=Diplogelasinospora grovesii TaxID=303347 RepID=A0AAN6NEH2_9PEZI|nr:GPI ethanolamine phosphate transferase 2 [Diplogelasinospora grovesii]